MPHSVLFWQVYERLIDDESTDGRTRLVVESAFSGESAILAALESGEEELAAQSSVAEDDAEPSRAVFLERLDVTGFRGVGETTTLEFEPCPGLTVVVGRNGSGKSSLAEALEVLLTGDSLRWKNRPRDWLSGWKNLHYSGKSWIRGTFLVEGSGSSMQVQRRWRGDGFEDADLSVDGNETPRLEAWEEALETFRPILSYNEIGGALDEGPSYLFDLLAGVLGMEELTEAATRLASVRKGLQALDKRQKAERAGLENALEDVEDPRVARAKEALSKRQPDLDALMALVIDEVTGDDEVAALRRFATIELPAGADVLAAAEALRAAHAALEAANASFAGEEGRAVELLRAALAFHDHDPTTTCPVCGTAGVLDATWQANAAERVESFGAASRARDDATASLNAAMGAARRLVGRVGSLRSGTLRSLEPARAAHEVWANTPDDPLALAEHLERAFDGVETSYRAVRAEAEQELATLQAHWRPIRRSIESFVDAAAAWAVAKEKIKYLKAAEKWLKDADSDLRAQRFAPIRERAQAIWETLRHRSNVLLNDIRLEGTNTTRRVKLDVAVDGEAAVALGVMSQGELHSMLLSLFLPRLTLAESPFRFLIVDDPIQAMDPAKVDGLAQVLSDVAATHQVVVFTHDARLPEALRRMQLPARVVEVTRADRSAMTLRTTRSRPEQFLADAHQVMKSRNEFGPRVAPQVVPGLCRGALEAYLQSRAWTTLLRAGKDHAQIEEAIRDAQGVHPLAALALLGDASKGGELYAYLNRRSSNGTETFKLIKDGAHGEFKGNVEQLVKDTRELLRALGAQV